MDAEKTYGIVSVESGQAAKGPFQPKWRTIVLVVVALIVFVAVLRYVYVHSARPPEYVTARVGRGDIEPTVTTSGNLNAVVTVQIGSQVRAT